MAVTMSKMSLEQLQFFLRNRQAFRPIIGYDKGLRDGTLLSVVVWHSW